MGRLIPSRRRERFAPPSEHDVRHIRLALAAAPIVSFRAWDAAKRSLLGDDLIEYGRKEHQIDELRIELRPTTGRDDFGRRRRTAAIAVATIVRDRVEGIGEHNDARRQWNVLSPEASRIAGSVPALVMGQDSFGEVGVEWGERGEHVRAAPRMGDDGAALRGGEVRRLVDDVEERLVNLADVVKERDALDDLRLVLIELQRVGYDECVGGNTAGVRASLRVVGINRIEQCFHTRGREPLGRFAAMSFPHEERAGQDAGGDGENRAHGASEWQDSYVRARGGARVSRAMKRRTPLQ